MVCTVLRATFRLAASAFHTSATVASPRSQMRFMISIWASESPPAGS